MNILIKKTSQKYTISNGKYSILVEKFCDGRISIKTFKENYEFVFKHSKPEDIEQVASLIIEASKINFD